MVIQGFGLTNGAIILDEPGSTYYAGQLMSGNVHFKINEPLIFSAINIVYLGEALVQWTDIQNQKYGHVKTNKEVKYEGREHYMNFVQCVRGGEGMSTLSAGVHSLPFQLQIPFNIPSSFQRKEGSVIYRITVFMELPEPLKREKLVKEFQVVAPFIPSDLKNMMRPLELDFENIETCNCFCSTVPINFKILLPSSVFNLGSNIPIVVEVKNESGVEIYEISFKIVMRYTFRTTQPRSEFIIPEEVLVEAKKGPILNNTRGQFSWNMELPEVMLPNLDACNIMDLECFFRTKIRMTGCNDDVEEESQIYIGLLPSSDMNELANTSLAMHLPNAPIPNPDNPPAFAPTNVPRPINAYNRSLNIGYPVERNMNTSTSELHGSLNKINITLPNTNTPYQIGFQSQSIPAFPPYQSGESNNPVPPYPRSDVIRNIGFSQPVTGFTHETGQTGQTSAGHSSNSSQTNIAVVPSAPPL